MVLEAKHFCEGKDAKGKTHYQWKMIAEMITGSRARFRCPNCGAKFSVDVKVK